MGDLSQIRDASRTMNEEEEVDVASEEDAVEFRLPAKRQHVSGDPKEQSEADRQKLLTMFEPILD